jgi:hypothetical protein
VQLPKITENFSLAIPIACNALNIHEWVKSNIPNGQSGLALELFTLISFTNLISEPVSLKVLFHSMSYSEAGIRKQLRRLIKDGWVYLEANSNDRRVKKIIAHETMMETFFNYANILKYAYSESRVTHFDYEIHPLIRYKYGEEKIHNFKIQNFP